MLSPVVVAFLWTLILKRQGLLSQTLMGWNWIDEPIQWLTDPSWTMFWSVLIYTWANLGFYMLILLAGLQSIPRDLYEAAEMDGTSDQRVFWRITLPLLMPILLVVTVLSLKNQMIHQTINVDNQDPECDLDFNTESSKKKDIKHALTNSFGFGGTNGSIVFSKYD